MMVESKVACSVGPWGMSQVELMVELKVDPMVGWMAGHWAPSSVAYLAELLAVLWGSV